MVSGSLALLYFLLGFHGGRQGSGPNRGQSPVEWGDFPSVLVRTLVRPPPLCQPARPETQTARSEGQTARSEAQTDSRDWQAGPLAWLDGPEGEGVDGRTDGRTDKRKISPFYRTLSPIGAAALPPPMKTKEKLEQGKGTADHLMPLGYLLAQFV